MTATEPFAGSSRGDASAGTGAPLVSVITPCYTHAHFLADALQSALAQQHPAIELLVVNDGSPDSDIIEGVLAALPHPVVYIRQENAGIGAARNAALARARGTFIQFLDADDRLLPNAVRDGLAAFARHPACGLVWGLRRTIDGHGDVMYDNVGQLPQECGYIDLLETNIVGPPVGVLVRRDCLVDIGGFSTERCVEDYEMYLRMASRYPIHCHRSVVAEYRWHSHNLSRDNALMLRGVLRALELQRAQVGRDPGLRRALRRGHRDAWLRYHWHPGVARIGEHVRARQWGAALRSGAPLALRYPWRFTRAVLRSLGRSFRRR